MIAPEQLQQVTDAIRGSETAQGLLRDIEQLHRVVFHNLSHANWALARRSAEQILIADMLMRHGGRVEQLEAEAAERAAAANSPLEARQAIAARVHAYFTTPLGITIRRDLFGEDAIFFAPQATDWIRGAPADAPPTPSPREAQS